MAAMASMLNSLGGPTNLGAMFPPSGAAPPPLNPGFSAAQFLQQSKCALVVMEMHADAVSLYFSVGTLLSRSFGFFGFLEFFSVNRMIGCLTVGLIYRIESEAGFFCSFHSFFLLIQLIVLIKQ